MKLVITKHSQKLALLFALSTTTLLGDARSWYFSDNAPFKQTLRYNNPDHYASHHGIRIDDRSDLSNEDFSKANIDNVSLFGTNFYNVNLSHANMSRSRLEKSNFSAVNAYRTNFAACAFIVVRMQEGNFQNANFEGSSMYRANLIKANFANANFYHTAQEFNDLSKANFTNANLAGSFIIASRMDSTNFRNANIKGTSFAESKLLNVDFSGAKYDHETTFERAVCSNVKGIPTEQLSKMGCQVVKAYNADLGDPKERPISKAKPMFTSDDKQLTLKISGGTIMSRGEKVHIRNQSLILKQGETIKHRLLGSNNYNKGVYFQYTKDGLFIWIEKHKVHYQMDNLLFVRGKGRLIELKYDGRAIENINLELQR